MKFRFVFSLMLGVALSAAAQGGYQDGVDNFNAGRLDVAKAILDNTINQPTTDKAVAHFYLGNIDFANGNLEGAEANYNKGLQDNPNYANNYIGLGQVQLKKGNKKEAENYFNKALSLNKKDTSVRAGVARAYYNVDPVLYAKEINKNIEKALKDSKNHESAVYLLKGDMVAAENPGDAAGQFELGIEEDKAKGVVNREAYVKYANTYFRVAPDFAIKKLQELHELEPNSALAQRELAEKFYDNKQFGSAWKMYEKYVQNPNHFRRDEQRYAGLLFAAGQYDESIKWAEKILAEDSSVYPMYRILMLDYNAKEDYNKAEEAGAKLFAYPGASLVENDYVVYGNVLSANKKAPEAVAVYEKAISLFPENHDLLPKLSAVYERAGQEEEAVKILKQYLDAGNGTVNDLFSMARRYAALGRKLEKGTSERDSACVEGLKYIDMAIERVPDNFNLFYTKGQLALTKNDDKPDQATAEAFSRMLEILDSDPANRQTRSSYYVSGDYLLGLYYIDVDKEKAKAYLTDYLSFRPEDEDVAKLIESLNQ